VQHYQYFLSIVLIGVAVLSSGFLLGAQIVAVAEAHQGAEACEPKYYGGVNRGTACNRYSGSGNHHANWVDGCDRAVDGWKVRAWARITVGEYPGDWDPNGGDPGCANDQYHGFHLQAHRICVEVIGCSAWREHGLP
jgi:hypothetical protein